jgi:hypothetical protein
MLVVSVWEVSFGMKNGDVGFKIKRQVAYAVDGDGAEGAIQRRQYKIRVLSPIRELYPICRARIR